MSRLVNVVLNVVLLAAAVLAAAVFARELFVNVPGKHVARIRGAATQWNKPTLASIGGLAAALVSFTASLFLLAGYGSTPLFRTLQLAGLTLSVVCLLIWANHFFTNAGTFR